MGEGNGGWIVTGKWTARDILRKEAGSKTFGRLCVRKSVERVVWGRNCDILKICSTVQGMNLYAVNVFSFKLTGGCAACSLVDAIPDSLFSKQTIHLYPKTAMIQTCE